ncbi:MAG TPA: hypothetical protein VNU26_10785, partial [Mycobacteriales bacterium]|nr:hypothetical protein [Mycobacteriales bacterium]
MRSDDGPVGQQVLTPAADAASGMLSTVAEHEQRLVQREHDRSRAHAALLTDVLALARDNQRAGLALGTPDQLALLLDASSWRAHDLLAQAQLFDRLPGGLAALQAGMLTEEQTRAVTAQLDRLAPADAELVWQHLQARLTAERDRGINHPPARLTELIRRVIATVLPPELTDQRQRDATADDVTVHRHDDGTTSLTIDGVSGPNTQAALHRIAQHAQPAGSWDSRTDGQRRRDAAVDLLTGRTSLPLEPH